MTRYKREIDALAAQGIKAEAPSIEVVDNAQRIEPVAATDLGALAAHEAFMNELVLIRIATTTDPNAAPFVTLTVNDVGYRVQVHRGVPTPVRRFHVEVLARMRETRYTQPPRNMADPESGNQLIAHHAQVYAFEVIRDDNPRGRAWLEHILSEPA